MAGVTAQISASYKCFYKLWRRSRSCCRRLPCFYFSLVRNVSAPFLEGWGDRALSTASTECQTFVNEYRLSRVTFPGRLCTSPQTATPLCPPFVFPLCLSPLLPLWSLAWKGFFDCLRLCSQGRGICLKSINQWRKEKEEIGSICICMCLFASAAGLHVHRYLSFFCSSPASINSSFPVQSNPGVLFLVGLFLPLASPPTSTLSPPRLLNYTFLRQTPYYRSSSLLTGNVGIRYMYRKQSCFFFYFLAPRL